MWSGTLALWHTPTLPIHARSGLSSKRCKRRLHARIWHAVFSCIWSFQAWGLLWCGGLLFRSGSMYPPPPIQKKKHVPRPHFEDGDVIYGRPLKMPFIFSAWTFSCQRQKKKQKQNIKTNKQKTNKWAREANAQSIILPS